MKAFFAAIAAALGLPLLHVAQAPADQTPPAAKQESPRDKVLNAARSSLGWTEATGKNDGRNINLILDSVGLKGSGAPYCAAWVFYVGKIALGDKNPYPRSAWSPDMVKKPTWLKGKGEEPKPGDVGSIWFASKGRVAHVFLVEKNLGNVLITNEGNTSPDAKPGSAADRDGGGVYRKRRLRSQVHSVRNWID